ncbi:hypothetical protein [Micromonospora sp. NPDC126480]|uniref:HD domain-containing protein n=1 Tax=Micromonospora sp. NPDC126480 TaxID=3155312 RepID=UPI0033343FBA
MAGRGPGRRRDRRRAGERRRRRVGPALAGAAPALPHAHAPDRGAGRDRRVRPAGPPADPADADGGLLCDADLAVLAASPEAYDRYAAAIRREYAHVPEPQFRAGRARVLATLLARPTLYHHPALSTRWEQPARANLTRELTTPPP